MKWLRNARKIDEGGLEADASGECNAASRRLSEHGLKPEVATAIDRRDYVVAFRDDMVETEDGETSVVADFYAYSPNASTRRAIHISAEDGAPVCDARRREEIDNDAWLRKNADVARRISKPLCSDCRDAVNEKTEDTVERILNK
jgi:uncharacterized protein YlaI